MISQTQKDQPCVTQVFYVLRRRSTQRIWAISAWPFQLIPASSYQDIAPKGEIFPKERQDSLESQDSLI